MTTTNTKNKAGFSAILGVMIVFLFTGAGSIVTPALSSIAQMFPGVPFATITLLATTKSLMIIPFSLLAGAVAGKKIKYKTLTLLSATLIIVAGTAPYFMNDFIPVLVANLIVGAGVGLSFPLGNTLIMKLFDQQKAANLQGLGMTIMNVTGVVLQFLSGFVCSIMNVRYMWLLSLIMLIPMILVIFFMKEPEKQEVAEAEGEKTILKSKVPFQVYMICIGYGLTMIFGFPFILNMSAIAAIGGHSPAVTGTILSVYTIGGMLSGVLFGIAYKFMKKWIIPVCLYLTVGALCLGYFASANVVALTTAALIAGVTLFLIWPAIMMDFAEIVPADRTMSAIGILTAIFNFSMFLTSSYLGIVAKITANNSPTVPVLFGIFGVAIIAVIWTISKFSKKARV